MARAKKAIYGGTELLRGYCKNCKRYSFIIGGIRQCCERRVESVEIAGTKRMSSGHHKRKQLGKPIKMAILTKQDNKCYWCGRDFEETRYCRNGKFFKLRIVFDHYVPLAYCRSDKKENFVAACHLCNSIKSDLMFDDEEELRKYLRSRIESKGITYV